MTSAFARYKAQQQKAAGKKTQKVPRTKAEGIVAALADMDDRIAKRDLETLAAAEKINVIKAVDTLR